MATVIDRCFEFFRSVGMTTMFGNPGSTEELFLKDFPADFRYVLGLHEASVVNMAVGYALAGDRAALVNLHTAAGMGNAMAAIINAHHAKAPLVITAGQQHRAMEVLEPFLWGRQVEFARPYVKWSCEPHRAVDVPAALARAYHTAMSAPRGPVFVSICMDGLDDECPALATRTVAGNPVPDPTAIHTMAEVLNASRRVALVVGEELDDPETWPRPRGSEQPSSARRRTSASASRPATRSSAASCPRRSSRCPTASPGSTPCSCWAPGCSLTTHTRPVRICPRASAPSTSRAGGRADAPGPGRGRRSPRRSAPGARAAGIRDGRADHAGVRVPDARGGDASPRRRRRGEPLQPGRPSKFNPARRAGQLLLPRQRSSQRLK